MGGCLNRAPIIPNIAAIVKTKPNSKRADSISKAYHRLLFKKIPNSGGSGVENVISRPDFG